MRDDGFNDTEIGQAWLDSRKSALTAMTGLGTDRLAETGLRRGLLVVEKLGI